VNLTELILVLITYFVYAAFVARLSLHLLVLAKASGQLKIDTRNIVGRRFEIYMTMFLDIIFFRRLFVENKLLWIGSWTFHVSFFLVILGHLRYFIEPVPACIRVLQPLGVFAGYVLPLSLLFILVIRIASGRNKYVSYYNYFLLIMILLISLTGILLKKFYRTDLLAVKKYMLGILTFSPESLPPGLLFIIHFLLVLLLVPYLPFHFIFAPIVTMEARLRDEELKMLMYEK
jgi:nitrate reductase gamma subunit